MRKFRFNKLVRDDIAKSIVKTGGKVNSRILTDPELLIEAKKKLREEVLELLSANEDKLIEELSDVQEITDLICKLKGISAAKLKNIRADKIKKAGGFKKRIYIETVEIPSGSKWVDYYLSQSKRYPEIK